MTYRIAKAILKAASYDAADNARLLKIQVDGREAIAEQLRQLKAEHAICDRAITEAVTKAAQAIRERDEAYAAQDALAATGAPPSPEFFGWQQPAEVSFT